MARKPSRTTGRYSQVGRGNAKGRKVVDKARARDDDELPAGPDFHPGPLPPMGAGGDVNLRDEDYAVIAPRPYTYGPSSTTVLNEERKAVYLDSFARNGREALAAQHAGVSLVVVKANLRSDPDFAALKEEAWQVYRDRVIAQTSRLAFEGTWEPVVGRVGRDLDGIIGWKRRIEYRALEAEQRRCVPEYRPHSTLDVNARVGVLVVRQPPSEASWETTYGKEQLLTADPLEGIEGAADAMAATRLDPNGLDDRGED